MRCQTQNGGFSRLIDKQHKSASRIVGYSLTLLDEAAMWELSAVLHARLLPAERKFLTAGMIFSLTNDEYEEVINFVEGEE
jgi:hypothetical protein